MRKSIVAILAAILLLQPLALAAQETLPPWRQELPEGRQQATITVGETEVQVDLAMTPGEQTLGLGYRNGLDEDAGMLFVNGDARPRTFWMKGMRFCLDIIWIQDDRIVGAAQNVCPDPEGTADSDRATYSSGEPVTYVLEMYAGWLEEHGYGPGTHIDLSEIEDLDIP